MLGRKVALAATLCVFGSFAPGAAMAGCSGGLGSDTLSCTGNSLSFVNWATDSYLGAALSEAVSLLQADFAGVFNSTFNYNNSSVYGTRQRSDSWGEQNYKNGSDIYRYNQAGGYTTLYTSAYDYTYGTYHYNDLSSNITKPTGTYTYNGVASSQTAQPTYVWGGEYATVSFNAWFDGVTKVVEGSVTKIFADLQWNFSASDWGCKTALCTSMRFASTSEQGTTLDGTSYRFVLGSYNTPVAAVPGPIAGAGLPALLGMLGFAAWRRRRAA